MAENAHALRTAETFRQRLWSAGMPHGKDPSLGSLEQVDSLAYIVLRRLPLNIAEEGKGRLRGGRAFMTIATDGKGMVGRIGNPSLLRADGLPIRPTNKSGRWLLGVFLAAAVAGCLLFCHGCHGDVDDELFVPSAADRSQ
jgi:hypothetical protein